MTSETNVYEVIEALSEERKGLVHKIAAALLSEQTNAQAIDDEEFYEAAGRRLEELVKLKGIANVTLPVDENGHAFIDKDLHPRLYDWAVNG